MQTPTEESKYSFTKKRSSEILVKRLLEHSSRDDTIIDACACIGGNTITFAKYFKHVIAVEKNDLHYDALVSNTCGFQNIEYIKDSFLNTEINQGQILYFDPPWGGKGYKDKEKLDLFLDSINIIDIIKSQLTVRKIIALKAPENHNKQLLYKLEGVKVYEYVIKKSARMIDFILFIIEVK